MQIITKLLIIFTCFNITLYAEAESTIEKDIYNLSLQIGADNYNWFPPIDITNDLKIEVFLKERILLLKNSTRTLAISRIGPGAQERPTPVGLFVVKRKLKRHFSGEIEGAAMPYSMFIGDNGIALHAGNYNNYSRGCIRLPFPFAQSLYGIIGLGLNVEVYRSVKSFVDINMD